MVHELLDRRTDPPSDPHDCSGNAAPQPATTPTEAAPPPTAWTPPTAPSDGADEAEDDGGEAAPADEPPAAEGPPAIADDLFLPHLPPDHADEPEVFEEPPNSRKDPGADLRDYEQSPVDQLLDDVYGDWAHQNDGSHLDGGVEGDLTWQRRWKRIVDLPTTH